MSDRMSIAANIEALHRMADPPARKPASQPSQFGRVSRFDNGERGWEGADTHRLNRAHWSRATGSPINFDLGLDWETLVTRCTHEAQNNALMEGVIETHAADVVGPVGPMLEVQTESSEFNEWLEDQWSSWWSMPDIQNGMCGPEKIDLWVRMLWKAGEFVEQITTDSRADGTVQMRLNSIHPRRLNTSASDLHNSRIVLGVEKNELGQPIAYHIQTSPDREGMSSFFGRPQRFPASDIIHEFQVLEPGQARGVPWAASALPTIADLRDLDTETLDAIRAAAEFSIMASLKDADAIDADQVTAFGAEKPERRQINYLPPNMEISQAKPEHPHTNLIDYRNERLRELGRRVGMPLMKVRLSSEKHNFSQAKFDAGNYWRMVEKIQRWFERRVLTRLLVLVEREARASQIVSNRRGVAQPPENWQNQLTWTWNGAPPVDPRIESVADTNYRGIGAMTMAEILKRQGKTVEQHVMQLKRERQTYEDEGVPYPEVEAVTSANATDAEDELEDDAEEESPESEEVASA